MRGVPTATPVSELPASDPAAPARDTLVQFFEYLEEGEYSLAAELYGGSYDTLVAVNSRAMDHAALFENACTINGYQCLRVGSAELQKIIGAGRYRFLVTFLAPDGELFVRGPCCGATEAEMPPQSQFEYEVAETEPGDYRVLDLPVYVP
jgi:hypothetical protein